jgi:hypothetical protein
MGVEQDLMKRLEVSKKIMEKAGQINRGSVRSINSTPMVEEYESVNGKYNIPQDLLMEQNTNTIVNHDPTKPLEQDKILNSKLPDEIKKLMIEQPIVQPGSMGGSAEISNEVIQGAQRLMNLNSNKISDQPKKQVSENSNINLNPTSSNNNINISEIKSMIRDVVRDTVRDVIKEELKQSGMIVESSSDVNEKLQFKVGKHLFIGNITKMKKLE